ncbi:MAG TPA: hypothetical protein VM711_10810 [Sphingomicrobium sp.]|nr:hypothetical protein [Sphingomicrobium sp.]
MENWKRAVLAGSTGLAVILLLKRKHAAGLISAGVAVATLASEYPHEFSRLRSRLPYYMERASNFVEITTRLGERLADVTGTGRSSWYEALLRS